MLSCDDSLVAVVVSPEEFPFTELHCDRISPCDPVSTPMLPIFIIDALKFSKKRVWLLMKLLTMATISVLFALSNS
ncbi:hypothetical protein JHK86_023865 [Glycine max]|nr:hypothetical protein JHK86_023865 [Glycine max]